MIKRQRYRGTDRGWGCAGGKIAAWIISIVTLYNRRRDTRVNMSAISCMVRPCACDCTFC